MRGAPKEFKVIGKVNIFTSKLPGLGKTRQIRDLIADKKKMYVRVPLYGEQGHTLLIKLLNDKMARADQEGQEFALHLDVHPMNKGSIHKVLFQLLVLRKVRNKMGSFASIPPQVYICVEIANTFQDHLYAELKYLKKFGRVKIRHLIPKSLSVTL